MNVVILDQNMEKSAQMLDDAHLKSQINEAIRILMLVYNYKAHSPATKIVDPLVKMYLKEECRYELFGYIKSLIQEYKYRFEEIPMAAFWYIGFMDTPIINIDKNDIPKKFRISKATVKGVLTDDINIIRKNFKEHPSLRGFTWTKRSKPSWWYEI